MLQSGARSTDSHAESQSRHPRPQSCSEGCLRWVGPGGLRAGCARWRDSCLLDDVDAARKMITPSVDLVEWRRLVQMLSPQLGRERGQEVLTEAAARLGLRPDQVEFAQALELLD